MSSFANTMRPESSSSSCARIGSTARQGPHHGAQKSTTTGVSACRTSCSKLASVSSSTPAMLPTGARAKPVRPLSGIASDASETARQCPEPQYGDLPDSLGDDGVAHLRAAVLAVDEADRHLDHAEARAQRAVG